MSFVVNLLSLSEEEKKNIRKTCTIQSVPTIYENTSITLRAYSVEEDEVILPLGIWKEYYQDFPNNYVNHNLLKDTEFKGKLKTTYPQDQTTVCEEALEILQKNHSVLLALYTGFGKTVTSIWLLLSLGLKAIVVCPIIALHSQWKERIEQFSNLKVQIVKNKVDPTADVYVLGAKKLGNMKYSDFMHVGVLIVDEIERICTKTFSLCLRRVRPQFLIGCSATPDRPDGLDAIFSLYFPSKFLFREKVKNFEVIKYNSEFIPDIKSNRKGELDWTHLQNSLSYNPKRQKFICQLIEKYYEEHRIIVMAKRVEEILAIYTILRKKNLSVDYVTQQKNKWDNSCRVLIGTYKKIGVGLDINDRDLTIFAGDVKDIRQPEGRIRLSDNTIIDIVDNNSTLERHWLQRRRWYLKRGASISYEGASHSRNKSDSSEDKGEWLLPPT